MRLIIGIASLILGTGTVLCHVDGLSDRSIAAAYASMWVRTVDGWERYGNLQPKAMSHAHMHPLCVAAGQGLISLFALVASQRDNSRQGQQG